MLGLGAIMFYGFKEQTRITETGIQRWRDEGDEQGNMGSSCKNGWLEEGLRSLLRRSHQRLNSGKKFAGLSWDKAF
jgi:hypothetical protein